MSTPPPWGPCPTGGDPRFARPAPRGLFARRSRQECFAISVAAGVVAALTAIAALVMGLAPGLFDESVQTPPLRVQRNVPLPLPTEGGHVVTLFGATAPDAQPHSTELGCRVTKAAGEGTGVSAFLSDFPDGDPRTVEGHRLAPVLKVSRVFPGDVLTCTGEAIDRLAPVYLVGTGGEVPTEFRLLIAGFAMFVGVPMFVTISLVAASAGRRR